MKKVLVIISIFIGLSFLAWKLPAPYAGNTFPATGNVGIGTLTPAAPLHVVGQQYIYDASNVGGTKINVVNYGGGNLQTVFNSTMIGDYMIVGIGGSNVVDFAAQKIQALTRGAAFNTLQVTTGATNGYVFTSDASGNGTWQPPSSGSGTSGTYTPTFYPVANVVSSTVYGATYMKVGNTVHVMLPFALVANAINTITNMDISLPPAYPAASTSVLNGGTLSTNNGVNGTSGIVSFSSTTKARISFPTPVLNPSGYINFMYTTP